MRRCPDVSAVMLCLGLLLAAGAVAYGATGVATPSTT